MPEHLMEARRLLEAVTPLSYDCGALCDHACCREDEDGQGGVWLLPGEAETLEGKPWAKILPGDIPLLMCQGPCDREDRPFLCRLFPLIGVIKNGRWTVRLDRRAWAVCPLMQGGMRGLNPAFTDAAQQAVQLLGESAEFSALLKKWAAIERSFAQAALPEADGGTD